MPTPSTKRFTETNESEFVNPPNKNAPTATAESAAPTDATRFAPRLRMRVGATRAPKN